jgi:hypothetical protein
VTQWNEVLQFSFALGHAIASALGARVFGIHKGNRWFPIEATPSTANTFHFPEKMHCFHWHGETFDLFCDPLSEKCGVRKQAFQIAQHVIGLQFHLETTPESARALLDNCGDELVPGPYVQTVSELREVPSAAYFEINSLMSKVLAYLTRTSV